MLLILFGLPGCGKNYVGEILQSSFGFYFYDGDDALTDDMRDCLNNGYEETTSRHYFSYAFIQTPTACPKWTSFYLK